MPPTRWVSAKEAASAVQVHEKTLRRWLRARSVVAKMRSRDGAWLVALDSDGHTIPTRGNQ